MIFFSSRRRHTRCGRDWSSDVCSSDLRRGPVKERELISFIERTEFPCVGAKSALNQGGLYVLHARLLTSAWNDVALHSAIVRFTEEHANRKRGFRSLITLFDGPLSLSERAYEEYLWKRLQSWTDKDVWLGYKNDMSVSSDPTDAHFSLSFGGHAFFAVGLHPRASRKARYRTKRMKRAAAPLAELRKRVTETD